MKASDVLNEIRQAVVEEKEHGHSTVSIDAMINYLKALGKDVENYSHNDSLDHEAKLTEFKAENDRNIAHSNNENSHSLEMFKAVITAGQSALRSSMLINGGAAVALLAFAGKIWATPTSELVANSLTCSILLFCLGVLSSAIATGTTYLSQFSFARGWLKVGNRVNVFTIGVILSSYALFAVGSFKAANSLGVHFGL